MLAKKMRGILLLLTAALMGPAPAFAVDHSGFMVGEISGYVVNDAGEQVTPRGVVEANLGIDIDGESIIAHIAGTGACTGGLGLFINFEANYNVSAGSFTGTFTDNSGAAPRPIEFSHIGGLSWKAHLDGTSPAENGAREYSIDVALTLSEAALFTGEIPAGRSLSGNLNSTQDVTIPIVIPGVINDEIAMTLITSGTWEASIVPTDNGGFTVSGHATGTFSSQEPVNVTGPYGIPVSIPVTGTFGGSFFDADASGNSSFSGNWAADENFGGDLTIGVNYADLSSFSYDISGTMPVSLSSLSLDGMQIPGLPDEFTIPINFSGIFQTGL